MTEEARWSPEVTRMLEVEWQSSERNAKKAENDNPDFANLGGHWLELDVTSTKCEETVAKAVKEFDIDVLVNNAGYAEGGTLEDSR